MAVEQSEVGQRVLERYSSLLRAYLDGQLSTEEFERRYLDAFKSEAEGMSAELFSILDGLFSDVDSYSSECPTGQETSFVISEPMLRRQVALALARIERLA
jgi:hypothetical protein